MFYRHEREKKKCRFSSMGMNVLAMLNKEGCGCLFMLYLCSSAVSQFHDWFAGEIFYTERTIYQMSCTALRIIYT